MKLSEKQDRWLKELEQLWNFLDACLKNYKLQTNDFRLIVLLHLTVAAHRLIRGFIAQMKGGSNDNLESKLRTLIEVSININYIFADETDNRAKAFVLNGTKSRITALNRIIRLLEQGEAPSMAGVNTIDSYRELRSSLESELSEHQRLLGSETVRWPNIELRAQRGHSEELYATVFWLFSGDTHMTAESLNRFLSEIDGEALSTTELDLSMLDQEIQTAFISYIDLINICSQRFDFPTEEELKEFNNSEMKSL